MDHDLKFMAEAIAEARKGFEAGGVPIGSVIVVDGEVIGRGHNQRVQQGSPILHGEMAAFEDAGRQPASVYARATIYTTLSPCSMCSGTILLYKIPRVVVGERHTYQGEEPWLESHGVAVTQLDLPECKQLMDAFIERSPELWNEDIGV
jgi:cytosine deaminase